MPLENKNSGGKHKIVKQKCNDNQCRPDLSKHSVVHELHEVKPTRCKVRQHAMGNLRYCGPAQQISVQFEKEPVVGPKKFAAGNKIVIGKNTDQASKQIHR